MCGFGIMLSSKLKTLVGFYAPIITNTLCLQCHGKPGSDIKPKVLASLKDLYPNDMAKGYDANQVRGLWSIDFKDEHQAK